MCTGEACGLIIPIRKWGMFTKLESNGSDGQLLVLRLGFYGRRLMEEASSGPFIWPWHHVSFSVWVVYGSATRRKHTKLICVLAAMEAVVWREGPEEGDSDGKPQHWLQYWTLRFFYPTDVHFVRLEVVPPLLASQNRSKFVPFPLFTTSAQILKESIYFVFNFFCFSSSWVSVDLVCLEFESSTTVK